MLPDDFEEKYPLSDYVYLAEQKNVSSGGYFYEADPVIIDGDPISFGLSDRCYEPKKGQAVPCVMGSFSFFAAVPREYVDISANYSEWTR